MLKTVTDTSFESDVLAAERPVIVDFWAEWCGPCHAIAPALEALAADNTERLTVVKLNVDENPQTPVTYGIRGIPTLLLFNGGQMVASKVGVASKAELQSWIDDAL